VTLEIIKLVQIYFINTDLMMYDGRTSRFAEAKTSTINEDLGQIQYIFSDKTGTLTENVMVFRKFAVSGLPFSLVQGGNLFSELDHVVEEVNGDLERLGGGDATEFMLGLALCHSCQIDGGATGKLVYQSSSPDEVALVSGAAEMKTVFKSRNVDRVFVSHREVDMEFQVLCMIEFTSKRKRMSVVYRYPDGRIMLLVKGADSVIVERMRTDEDVTGTVGIVDRFSCEGLRTLMYAYKELSEAEYGEFKRTFDDAALKLEGRETAIEEAAEGIERDLMLLGATAIEDRLQDQVPETIDKLRRAGIKLWMLTVRKSCGLIFQGDKKETAINIAGVCQIIKPDSTLIHVDGNDMDEILKSVKDAVDVLGMMWRGETEKRHVVLVVEGATFTKIQTQHKAVIDELGEGGVITTENSVLMLFLDLAATCDNVICCRFSPSQKAVIVARIKEMLNESIDGTVGLFSPNVSTLSQSQRMYFSMKPKRFSGVTLAVGLFHCF
jgi:phospholipid-transporting ATPase